MSALKKFGRCLRGLGSAPRLPAGGATHLQRVFCLKPSIIFPAINSTSPPLAVAALHKVKIINSFLLSRRGQLGDTHTHSCTRGKGNIAAPCQRTTIKKEDLSQRFGGGNRISQPSAAQLIHKELVISRTLRPAGFSRSSFMWPPIDGE